MNKLTKNLLFIIMIIFLFFFFECPARINYFVMVTKRSVHDMSKFFIKIMKTEEIEDSD